MKITRYHLTMKPGDTAYPKYDWHRKSNMQQRRQIRHMRYLGPGIGLCPFSLIGQE